jgi:hypothetical protein
MHHHDSQSGIEHKANIDSTLKPSDEQKSNSFVYTYGPGAIYKQL